MSIGIPVWNSRDAIWQSIVIDDADFERVNKYKWYLAFSNGRETPQIVCGERGIASSLARYLLDLEYGDPNQVDHIDGNRLNNRRSNLRLCNNTQNNQNRKLQRNSTTGFKGVCKDSFTGRYKAYISIDGKIIHLGRYDTPERAARAYDDVARKHFGEFAVLNFPKKQT